MRPWLVLVLAGLFLQALAMPSRAATTALTSIPSAGDCAIGPLTSSVAAVALGANAGSVDFVATYPCRPIPATDAGPFIWTVNIDGPQLLAGGLAGTSVAMAKTYTGCAVSGADSAVSDFALTADHYALASAFTFNSGSSVCSIYLAVTITIATTATTHFRVILTIARETNYRLEYICDHSATTPLAFVPNSNSCGTLNENNAITGSLTLSGTLNAVLSGAVSLSGGLTVSDDAGGWAIHQDAITGALTLSGSLSTAVSGSLATTVSGGLTITDDANGWAVHQDPITGTLAVTGVANTTAALQSIATAIQTLNRLRMQVCGDVGDVEAGACSPLNAALSGALTVHQDPICTAAAHCHIDTNATTVTIGNTTVNVPDHQTLCGPGSTPPYNATTCKPLQGAMSASVASGGFPDFLALAWLVALVWAFRLGKLLAGSVAAIGAVAAFIASNVFLVAGIVAFFVIAIYLEAFARERLYSRFINPETKNP